MIVPWTGPRASWLVGTCRMGWLCLQSHSTCPEVCCGARPWLKSTMHEYTSSGFGVLYVVRVRKAMVPVAMRAAPGGTGRLACAHTYRHALCVKGMARLDVLFSQHKTPALVTLYGVVHWVSCAVAWRPAMGTPNQLTPTRAKLPTFCANGRNEQRIHFSRPFMGKQGTRLTTLCSGSP